MTNPHDLNNAMLPVVPEPVDSQMPRKPYRAPDVRKLGDMKQVTLKTGPLMDNSTMNPSRP